MFSTQLVTFLYAKLLLKRVWLRRVYFLTLFLLRIWVVSWL